VELTPSASHWIREQLSSSLNGPGPFHSPAIQQGFRTIFKKGNMILP
jgi:hypothetical protein